jgi:hypothetical protein
MDNEDELIDGDAEPVFEPEPLGRSPTGEPEEEAAGGSVAQKVVRTDIALNTLKHVHEAIGHVIKLLEEAEMFDAAKSLTGLITSKRQMSDAWQDASGVRVVEGVFDGASMVAPDGKLYSVPPNYASKSRLVEGDMLKLTIRSDGSFVFKQIAPIERRRVVGCLAFDDASGGHVVVCGEAAFKVLPASVSYYKGQPGDEVVLLVPKSGKSVWGAVENIVRK